MVRRLIMFLARTVGRPSWSRISRPAERRVIDELHKDREARLRAIEARVSVKRAGH